ncbi:uncharacterized protein ACBT57_025535 isoform 2-T5 [Dama dama]
MSGRDAAEGSSHSLQLEKDRTQQRRPGTAKNNKLSRMFYKTEFCSPLNSSPSAAAVIADGERWTWAGHPWSGAGQADRASAEERYLQGLHQSPDHTTKSAESQRFP